MRKLEIVSVVPDAGYFQPHLRLAVFRHFLGVGSRDLYVTIVRKLQGGPSANNEAKSLQREGLSMTNEMAGNTSPLSIKLEDGSAEYMGGGMLVVHQRDETAQDGHEAQSITLSTQDLEAIGAAQALTVPLEDGVAERTDADLWCILQRDHEAQAAQSVVLSRQDLGVMLAIAA